MHLADKPCRVRVDPGIREERIASPIKNLGNSRIGKTAVLWELSSMLKKHNRLWLVPFVGILALTAVMLTAVAVIEYVAPFVYTVF